MSIFTRFYGGKVRKSKESRLWGSGGALECVREWFWGPLGGLRDPIWSFFGVSGTTFGSLGITVANFLGANFSDGAFFIRLSEFSIRKFEPGISSGEVQ